MKSDMNIKKVLWASIEDYCGLWEVVWEINTLHPNLSSKASQHVALQCILQLISKDLVKLFYCQEPYGEMMEITDKSSYPRLLQDSKSWNPPMADSRSVRVSATDSGKKYYKDMKV